MSRPRDPRPSKTSPEAAPHSAPGNRPRDAAGRAPGTGPAGGSAAFLAAQVGAHAAMMFAERLARHELAPPHAGVLRQVALAPGISQRELGARLSISPSRLVGLLDELEERGLIERRDDPSDRRTYALALTEAGRRALEQVATVAREHDQAVCEPLSPAERDELARLLRRLAEHHGLTPGVHPGFRKL